MPDDLETPVSGPVSCDFILLFDKGSGSKNVSYFMVDPCNSGRIFPKMNTIRMNVVKDLSSYKTAVKDNMLYIMGGKDWNTGSHIAAMWRFDPVTNQWIQLSPMITARCRFTAEVIGDFIYIIGGETSSGRITDSMERYDTTTDTWYECPDLPRPRADHASCVLGDRLYVSGGISNLKHQSSDVFWIYEPRSEEWTDTPDDFHMPRDLEKHSMVPVGASQIYVLKGRGFDKSSCMEKDEETMFIYNEHTTDTTPRCPLWDTNLPVVSKPCSNGAAFLLGDVIWTIGGRSHQKDEQVKVVQCFDTKRRRWRDAFSLPDGNYMNVDVCKLRISSNNKDFSLMDRFIYKRWIMW
ncbi:kelch-like protein 13 [Gigantopelta aegis]|uniref:kelch-like protein 13 n=1 Tax=Gigantopelta aegis TaxID=1735272 RepID=UPI001B887663|nr:kelch-like protein 13 [Gigantopelta aegis]XP_041353491.1 kelch-like protein 13 [Gigantopelta aegis]